jgi:hypothetical protein
VDSRHAIGGSQGNAQSAGGLCRAKAHAVGEGSRHQGWPRTNLQFFPKYHPEFNFIERYWGMAKRYLRERCDYSFKELQPMVPERGAPFSFIDNDQTIAQSLLDVHESVPGRNTRPQPYQVEWALRKYSSHRRVKGADHKEFPPFLSPDFMKDCPPA